MKAKFGTLLFSTLLMTGSAWAQLPELANGKIVPAVDIAGSEPQVGTHITPRRPHSKQRAQLLTTDERSARIVLKFHEGTGVRLGSAGLAVASGLPRVRNPHVPPVSLQTVRSDLKVVHDLASREDFLIATLVDERLERLYRDKLRAEQYWQHEIADMRLYFQLVMPDWGKHHDVRALVARLNRLISVEIAYAPPVAFPPIIDKIAAPPADPLACGPADLGAPPDFEGDQGYLSSAPIGVDALAAWGYAGGRGNGIRVVDVEGGYRDHADHGPLQFITGHQFDGSREHGRAVVGVLAALDNGLGTTGIVSNADIIFRSIYNGNFFDDLLEAANNSANVAHHIYWAGKHSIEGVVLIELQGIGPYGEDCGSVNCSYVPVEYWPDTFDQIVTTTGTGVVVVEAAGNGGRNLDDPVFGGAFDPSVQDSGAILVGSSRAETRIPIAHHNNGSRVDVHSWGENVLTTYNDHPLEWGDNHCNVFSLFDGTSSASAIIAGVATSIQGVAQANLGYRLDPLTLRQLLVDTGTPQAPGPDGELIGPQPDLAAAIEELLP